jgi:hypothetical protein
VGSDLSGLQLAGAVFSIGLIATLGYAVGSRLPAGLAIAVCLPVAWSLYVISSAAWLLPDNAGWWGVLGVLLIAFYSPLTRRWCALAGLILLGIVLVRQIHVWSAAILFVAAWSTPDPGHEHEPERRKRLAMTLLAIAPALLVLAAFAMLWHGFAAPTPRRLNGGVNPAAPAMILAVAGAVGLFYALLLVPQKRIIRRHRPIIFAATIASVVISTSPPTNYDIAAGRWSGLWNIAAHCPTIGNRSTLVIALAALGGAILCAWAIALPNRARAVFIAAWLGFTLANTATHEAFQRYYEPFALIMFSVAAGALPKSSEARTSRLAWVGPVLLAIFFLGLTAMSLR